MAYRQKCVHQPTNQRAWIENHFAYATLFVLNCNGFECNEWNNGIAMNTDWCNSEDRVILFFFILISFCSLFCVWSGCIMMPNSFTWVWFFLLLFIWFVSSLLLAHWQLQRKSKFSIHTIYPEAIQWKRRNEWERKRMKGCHQCLYSCFVKRAMSTLNWSCPLHCIDLRLNTDGYFHTVENFLYLSPSLLFSKYMFVTYTILVSQFLHIQSVEINSFFFFILQEKRVEPNLSYHKFASIPFLMPFSIFFSSFCSSHRIQQSNFNS